MNVGAEPDDETVAALVALARELRHIDAEEARRRLDGLTADQRAVVERAPKTVAKGWGSPP